MANPSLESLKKLQSTLMQMHRYLMASLKADRENEMGQAITATDWLYMMISDPEYSWLKPLTGLMADIDALMDNYEVTEKELKIIRQELDNLFLLPSENAEDFITKYQDLARRDSDVMLYNGHLRQLILALPSGDFVSDSADIRRSWHQRADKRHS